jgi:CheY-like chemotaxis protein
MNMPIQTALVADDHDDSRQTLAVLLEVLGYRVLLARNGREALEVACSTRPDLIFLDIGMPEVDGWEVSRRIREEPWGNYPFLIAITGFGTDADYARSKAVGFDLHCTKPLKLETVQKLLGHNRRPA